MPNDDNEIVIVAVTKGEVRKIIMATAHRGHMWYYGQESGMTANKNLGDEYTKIAEKFVSILV